MTIYQKQLLLAYLGYSPGPIDGIDGVKTQAALAAFRRDYGVGADGLIGAITGTVPKLGTTSIKPEPNDYRQALAGYLQQDGKYHIPKDVNIQVAENFSSGEFACKCKRPSCRETVIHPALIDAVQLLRQDLDKPVAVNSGYRCPAHNASVGGAAGSLHTLGLAADLRCPGATPARMATLAEGRANYGEIGTYKWGVHLGAFRPDGRHTRWNG